MNDESRSASATSLSKRGARRVIQRAVVLMGRDKAFRQTTRSVKLNTHWRVEEWALEWTIVLNQGRLEFYRGHTGRPRASLLWKSGDEFLGQIETGKSPAERFELNCESSVKSITEMLLVRFCATLRSVLANPVDDEGVRLI